MMNGFWGWGLGFGPVFMLLFWGLLIVGIIALIRWLGKGSSPSQARERTAVEIVQERYARGEIDRQEYEQKMQDLERRS
ncbi:MAG: SHOCT domain-containing protein [Sulfuritalea sp.]|nr:SHOCT domain-containing protein [Sulfuritalea sp.]